MLIYCDAQAPNNPHTVKLHQKNWQSMMIINARKSSRGKGFRTEWRMLGACRCTLRLRKSSAQSAASPGYPL
jgi:hypothetical protein